MNLKIRIKQNTRREVRQQVLHIDSLHVINAINIEIYSLEAFIIVQFTWIELGSKRKYTKVYPSTLDPNPNNGCWDEHVLHFSFCVCTPCVLTSFWIVTLEQRNAFDSTQPFGNMGIP